MTALGIAWHGAGGLDAAARPLRVCRKCGETKTLTGFRKAKTCRLGFAHICRVCWNAQELVRHHRDPGRTRRRKLKYLYGLTEDEYNGMLSAQKGTCAICHTAEQRNDSKRPGRKEIHPLHVDHDHSTGEVRGLLCYRCNNGIGLLRDPAYLRAAADYLERGRTS